MLHEALEKVVLLPEEVLFFGQPLKCSSGSVIFKFTAIPARCTEGSQHPAITEARQQAENSVIWWFPLDEDV